MPPYKLLAFCSLAAAYAQNAPPIPVAGRAVAELQGFDAAILSAMRKWNLQGGQLAIAKDGRLLLSRAYGYADPQSRRPVQLDSLFRIGSVSKTLTTVAILQLVETGKIRLSDKAFSLLPHLKPPAGTVADPRLLDVTIQNLLQHAGGWQETEPSFTMPFTTQVAEAVGPPNPPSCESVIRFQLSRPLDFPPGSKTSYSNFGFCILGRIIESVAGTGGKPVPYEEWVRKALLGPAGIKHAKLAGTLLSERADKEVRYHGPPNQEFVDSVYPGQGRVPFAYGGIDLKSTDASGGWIASAEDLVKFATALDGQRGRPLLRPTSIRQMLDTPIPASNREGLCWTVVKRAGGADFWHIGAIRDSNVAWLVRTSEGAALAVVFNSFPADLNAFLAETVPSLLDLLRAPRTWPRTGNLRWTP